MTSLSAVANALRAAADSLPIALLGDSVDGIEEATTLLATATTGTHNPEAAQVLAIFTEAYQEAGQLLVQVMALHHDLHALANRLAPNPGAPPPPPPPHPPDQIDEIRQSLPPGISGAAARGIWLGPGTKTTPLRSGPDDEWHDKARAFAQRLPQPLRAAVRLATHIEVKFAMRMREEQLQHATVIIDRPVCGTTPEDAAVPFTCDKKLERFLPPGSALRVVERNGSVRIYRGRDDN